MNAPSLSIMLRTYAPEPPDSWQPVLDVARAADAAGVDRLVVSDHVVFGEHLDAYGRPESGGVEGGRQPTGPDGHWLEPLTALTFVAGMTSRIRLGTNILLAALRRPVVLAKTAATLDVLSGGRLDLGVGIGWQREEYEAAGLDFGNRGELLDHTLLVCQAFWRETAAKLDTPMLAFDAIHMMPKPAQPGGVPIWVSGRINGRVVQRLARFGAGWIPWGDDALSLVSSIPRMRAAVEAAGRDPTGIQVAGTLPLARADDKSIDLAKTMAGLPPLVAAGVTDFRAPLPIPAGYDPAVAYLEDVVGAFRAAVA
ncbi:MAG: TIGR03619 family F420-dependent LLM class oxidoreductase [Actinobacteria bacterium]|nr:MAG: TIGR03619 family F420-dependent LLM class oxidoreductase [Actinomycetota bacterium]